MVIIMENILIHISSYLQEFSLYHMIVKQMQKNTDMTLISVTIKPMLIYLRMAKLIKPQQDGILTIWLKKLLTKQQLNSQLKPHIKIPKI